RKEDVYGTAGADGIGTWKEEKHSPTPTLALAAKALGPFPLPKLTQAAYEFWAFKPSAGDAATTSAIALQLSALDIYDQWLAVLKEAQAAGIEALPTHAADLRDPSQVYQLMQALRRTFQADPELTQRVERTIDRKFAQSPDTRERRLLAALAALYA